MNFKWNVIVPDGPEKIHSIQLHSFLLLRPSSLKLDTVDTRSDISYCDKCCHQRWLSLAKSDPERSWSKKLFRRHNTFVHGHVFVTILSHILCHACKNLNIQKLIFYPNLLCVPMETFITRQLLSRDNVCQ